MYINIIKMYYFIDLKWGITILVIIAIILFLILISYITKILRYKLVYNFEGRSPKQTKILSRSFDESCDNTILRINSIGLTQNEFNYRTRIDRNISRFSICLIVFIVVIILIGIISLLELKIDTIMWNAGFAAAAVGVICAIYIQNYLGGAWAIITNSFGIGDLIEINGYVGVIQRINMMHIELLADDNIMKSRLECESQRIIFIPNHWVFTYATTIHGNKINTGIIKKK